MRFFAAGLVLSVVGGNAFAVETTWARQVGGNDHSYEVVFAPDGISWLEATRQATMLGGYLATIESAEENAFVFTLIDHDRFWTAGPSGLNYYGPWIGGYTVDAATWRWVSGAAFGFAAWAPGQPDFHGRYESKAHFWSTVPGTRAAAWNDLGETNTTPKAFVVEFDGRT